MLTSTTIAVALGGWIGVMSGINRGSTTSSVVLVVLVSIPTFWLGLVSIYIFALKLGWLPAGGREVAGGGSVVDILQHLLLPALVLAMVQVAV